MARRLAAGGVYRDQIVEGAARGDHVGNVLVARVGRVDDRGGHAHLRERFGYLLRVAVSGFVAVGDHDHLGADQARCVLIAPLPCASWVAGRHAAGLFDRVDVALTLDDEHPRAGLGGSTTAGRR
jgi:hypothetical protein